MEKSLVGEAQQKWAPCMPVFLVWGNGQPEELLYAAYTQRQKQHSVPWLLVAGVLMQIYCLLVPRECSLVLSVSLASVSLLLNVMMIIAHRYARPIRPVLPYIVCLLLWIQVLANASRRFGDAYDELLGWAAMFLYLTLASVPYSHFHQFLYSVMCITSYIVVQYINASLSDEQLPEDLLEQQLANGSLLLAASILGAVSFTIWDGLQRGAFKETKKSLLDKLVIEQQSKEQERLLLSVLPEHVAVQMRQDLGLIDTQFKKIYMSRHENVSILYADIVGFTAISSTYSAQDLVAILNELFARFDRLAEKYQQLRIKILGDCYYCISGAPVERPDHAVLCIHMGLSMVKAIKYVQQTTNSPVDMRVGIHTGAVLAGVLGQRQWQFDVYSRDVELANKMESSGMAGRVHISEMTLSFLKDEFEVEPAYGEKREEMLRQAGIKTYFIVKVLKPYQGQEEKGGTKGESESEAADEGGTPDTPTDLKDEDEDSILSPQEESKVNEDMKILNMLEQELISRNDDKELADATTLCLTFKKSEMEEEYLKRPDPCPMIVVTLPMLLVPAFLIIAGFAVPSTWTLHAVYITLVLETGLWNIAYYACTKCAASKKKTINPYWKMICGVFNITMFVLANIIPLIICGTFETALDDGLREDAPAHTGARRCLHPSYYYHVGAAVACTVLSVPLGLVGRGLLLLAVAAAHAVPSALHPRLLLVGSNPDAYLPSTSVNSTDFTESLYYAMYPVYQVRHILMLFLIALALIIYNRYSESLERARHSRGLHMRAQAEQAADMRRRNQALVHNVLPPHVARHFMGARHHHRDLYSQSYAEVGVLFASMPNFSEFYSEESVNNQGLECLRFLNEVISDFDMLLEDPKYCKDIIKIKTISSTYMAASGLNPTRQMQPSDGIVVRWAHLACLVEFALELQRTLTAINEQSFNHFVLRLGVNHGPITAGVIGARKPHYDIWGNTVNVASRMESTGKAGCIQVTEETCQILQMFGYYFEQRGLVAVKGKGQLMTYYLQGKRSAPTSPIEKTRPEDDIAPNEGDSEALLGNGETNITSDSSNPISTDGPLPDDAGSSLLQQS